MTLAGRWIGVTSYLRPLPPCSCSRGAPRRAHRARLTDAERGAPCLATKHASIIAENPPVVASFTVSGAPLALRGRSRRVNRSPPGRCASCAWVGLGFAKPVHGLFVVAHESAQSARPAQGLHGRVSVATRKAAFVALGWRGSNRRWCPVGIVIPSRCVVDRLCTAHCHRPQRTANGDCRCDHSRRRGDHRDLDKLDRHHPPNLRTKPNGTRWGSHTTGPRLRVRALGPTRRGSFVMTPSAPRSTRRRASCGSSIVQ